MSKDVQYKQCLMEKNGAVTTAWIPEKFAVLNKFLKLEDVDGWKVKEVYSVSASESVVNDNSRDHLRTRKASDI